MLLLWMPCLPDGRWPTGCAALRQRIPGCQLTGGILRMEPGIVGVGLSTRCGVPGRREAMSWRLAVRARPLAMQGRMRDYNDGSVFLEAGYR